MPFIENSNMCALHASLWLKVLLEKMVWFWSEVHDLFYNQEEKQDPYCQTRFSF
jgi:hypothetical protein